MTNYENRFRALIATRLGSVPERIHFYWKGRVALYSILKAAGIGPGDEVILPGFTCVVVPNAILYLGAVPVYVDIDRETLNPSPEAIRAARTERTKAVILQNTFGLSSHVDTLASWAKSENILTVEDCTHGFGSTFGGKPNGTFCDASFFSTQWNKPFSTGIGGFSLVLNEALNEAVTRTDAELAPPSFKDNLVLSSLISAQRHLITPATYYFLRGLYRTLGRLNLTIGSSSGDELTDTSMPAGYFRGMAQVQFRTGIAAMESLDSVMERRRRNATLYTNWLADRRKYHVSTKLHADHGFLKYPLLVSDRDKFRMLAEKSRVELGDWFLSPLHPVEANYGTWRLDPARIPVACDVASRIVNLPTETENPEKVIAFLEKNSGLIE